MSRVFPRLSSMRRFASDTRGAALVEFGIVLPLMMVLFVVIVEGSRMLWGYQSVITAVRDETRYVARAVPVDVCSGTPRPESVSDANLLTRIRQKTYVVDVTSVTLTDPIDCSAGPPIAEVTASITLALPFRTLLGFVGGAVGDITTSVTDRSRIYGT